MFLRARWRTTALYSFGFCRSTRVAFSASSGQRSYADTISNLRIGPHTRVIYQGFTGRQATANAKQSIEYGTRVVGGVTPGRDGEHLGLPVLPTVRAAKEHLKPDATAIFVAAQHAPKAIEEAIEVEIPLIVAVAEHIPVHDILRIHSILATQSKCRLVGANAPGIISPVGQCRIGFQPLPAYTPGPVGVVAKSGTLSYETVAALTRAGVGQSLCIGMGGDVVAGTDFVDALRVFENDPETEGVVIVGEVGGRAEEEAAEWVRDYRKRATNPKPIAAVVAGAEARPGYIMGHAGAFASPGEASAEQKFKVLEDAGVTMVTHPSKFGDVMKRLLSGSGTLPLSRQVDQRRFIHTCRRPSVEKTSYSINRRVCSEQRRMLHLSESQSAKLLSKHGVEVLEKPPSDDARYLSVTIDRSARCPCFLVSPSTDPESMFKRARRIPYDYRAGPSEDTFREAVAHLQLDASPPMAQASAFKLMLILSEMFKHNEALSLSLHLAIDPNADHLIVSQPAFSFDDSAFRSARRQADIHSQREPTDLATEQDGIVYIKLGESTDPSHNIGTIINGAGLAMNTVDALRAHGGRAANFLDTGGKATSATVKQSFELVLRDHRVRAIFVNIFGGLTLGDMIAEGILLAFKELGLAERGVPVVVRIRGTNEKEGQRIVAESGLPVEAFDDFDEAARRVVELASRSN